MNDTQKIIDARIEPSSRDPLAKGAKLQATVYVKLEGSDKEELLFNYYDDELSFTTSEFVGLTVRGAYDLFFKKDVAYLQS